MLKKLSGYSEQNISTKGLLCNYISRDLPKTFKLSLFIFLKFTKVILKEHLTVAAFKTCVTLPCLPNQELDTYSKWSMFIEHEQGVKFGDNINDTKTTPAGVLPTYILLKEIL